MMDNTVIYIKCKTIYEKLKYVKESFSSGENRYYNFTNNSDEDALADIDKDEWHYIVVIVYDDTITTEKKEAEEKINEIYLGVCKWHDDDKGYKNNSLQYRIKRKITSKFIIKNIVKLSALDLESDFADSYYVTKEDSAFIAEHLDVILKKEYVPVIKTVRYGSILTESGLSELAQKNEYCERFYNARDIDPNRGEFQRDYERILHCKAFRRMVDKAQVFSASKGDYYRTRMTHTQIVGQIAGAISEKLGLNHYLTLAIAYGHDIGHTPFGHQGERTLDSILKDKIHIIDNADLYDDHFGGFKHNYQSVRVASKLEEAYADIYGLDLSYQTLEGMLKHTKLKKDKFKLKEFCDHEDAEAKLRFDIDFPTTLEGQVVALADEIAQRAHDLDDALSSGLITLEQFKKRVDIQKMSGIKDRIEKVEEEIKAAKTKGRIFANEKGVKVRLIVSGIISYFIEDIIDSSKKAIKNFIDDPDKMDDFGSEHRVEEQLIKFSDDVKRVCEYMEKIITNKVINSSEIAMFDSNAETIVAGLFMAYYNKPKLLPESVLKRIMIEFKKESNNVIDFSDSDHDVVENELEKIVHGDIIIKEKDEQAEEHEINENSNSLSDKEKKIYKIKRRILVRAICDYISGMTDSYARNQYSNIVK